MNNIDIVDMDIMKSSLSSKKIKMCLEMEYGIDVEREIAEKEYTNEDEKLHDGYRRVL